MKKKDLPTNALADLLELNLKMSQIGNNANAIISAEYKENNIILFKDIEEDSDFKFEVKEINFSKSPYTYTIEFAPSSGQNLKGIEQKYTKEQVINVFNWWVETMIYYNSVSLPQDEIFRQHKKEFYDKFKIVDEDADTTPFSSEQQNFLDKYLTSVETKLLKEADGNEEVSEVLKDVKELRKNIGRESKKQFFNKLSKIYAKSKKYGLSILQDFIEASKQELFKHLLDGGFDAIGGIIDKL